MSDLSQSFNYPTKNGESSTSSRSSSPSADDYESAVEDVVEQDGQNFTISHLRVSVVPRQRSRTGPVGKGISTQNQRKQAFHLTASRLCRRKGSLSRGYRAPTSTPQAELWSRGNHRQGSKRNRRSQHSGARHQSMSRGLLEQHSGLPCGFGERRVRHD